MKLNRLVLLDEQLRVSLEKGCGDVQQGRREWDSSFQGILLADSRRQQYKHKT